MRKQFGQFNPTKSEGLLRPVRFPSMAKLGVFTPDGRKINIDGAGVRELPRTIYAQFAQGGGGHVGAVAVGTLQEVTFEEESAEVMNVEGRGWLIDDPMGFGQQTAVYIATKALFHNSIDLNDVKAQYEYDMENDELRIVFTESNIGATTIVGKPAFADAQVELDDLTAALVADDSELEWEIPTFEITVSGWNQPDEEVTADGAVRFPWDDFHIPEPDVPTPFTIDADGRIFGHLSLWSECHGGYDNVCKLTPRPRDDYASFNQPGPLTDKGQVQTGPIFFLGGHPDKPLGNGDVAKAYGGIENAFGDVRATPGKLGPWLSGHVRPGLSEEALHTARCSRISGHWKKAELKAIVCVNVPGYNVPGSNLSADVDGFEFADGEMVELVASLPPQPKVAEETVTLELNGVEVAVPASTFRFDGAFDIAQVGQAISAAMMAKAAEESFTDEALEAADAEVAELVAAALELELALEDDDAVA